VAQFWKTSSLTLPCPADDTQTGLVVCHERRFLSYTTKATVDAVYDSLTTRLYIKEYNEVK